MANPDHQDPCAICNEPSGWEAVRVKIPVRVVAVAVEHLICRGCLRHVGELFTKETLSEIRERAGVNRGAGS